jgi:hypothetical protein
MSFPLVTNSERPDKAILWTRYLGIDEGYGAPIADSERIYVASPTKILCYGIDSGELFWEREFPKPGAAKVFQTNATLYKNNVFFCNPEGLFCLDRKTGKTVWENHTPFTSNAEVVSDTVYIASDEDIHVIDAKTGKTKKIVNVPDKYDYRFITFVEKNRVVASTTYGMKKLVDLAKKEVVWQSNEKNTELWDSPVVCGKYLAVSGYIHKFEWLLFIDIETGKIAKSMVQSSSCFDTSDGRILASDNCFSTETLEPIWNTGLGHSRFYDCFDSVFFWSYDEMSILDWNGNKVHSKWNSNRDISNSDYFWDGVWKKPAASNGKYALVTQLGYLVCYHNKPDMVTYLPGAEIIGADGKKVFLNTKPFANDDGELLVEPRGFLEPLGWVSSHVDGWWEDKTSDFMCFHDYNRIIAITASDDPELLQYIKADKIIKCQKTSDGRLIMPLEQMVSEFGLTMTKDGDRIKLSFQSK